MMGSCAFLMPIGGLRFIDKGSYSLRAAVGLAIGGIPAVLLAAFVVKSLPLTALRWLVFAVVLYTARPRCCDRRGEERPARFPRGRRFRRFFSEFGRSRHILRGRKRCLGPTARKPSRRDESSHFREDLDAFPSDPRRLHARGPALGRGGLQEGRRQRSGGGHARRDAQCGGQRSGGSGSVQSDEAAGEPERHDRRDDRLRDQPQPRPDALSRRHARPGSAST